MSGLDLYQTQGELLFMLAVSLAVGLGLGGVYDLLRGFRIFLWPQGKPTEGRSRLLWGIFLFGEDVLFVVISSISVILLCYYTNDGCFRAPAAVGMAGGFFVYVRIIGRLTAKPEAFLVKLVRSWVVTLLRLACRPFQWVFALLRGWWQRSLGAVIAKKRQARQERRDQRIQVTPETAEMPSVSHGKTVFSTRRSR